MVLAQQQQPQQGQLFGQERRLIKQKQGNLLLMQSALSAVAIAGLAMPVLDPSESTQMKNFSFFAGIASAAALFAVSSSSHAKQLDKLAEALEGGEKEVLKTHMGVRLAHAQQLAALNGRRQLVEQIMMTTYPHEWMSHAQRAGVADLLPPPPAPPPMEELPQTIEIASKTKTLQELEAVRRQDYDVSWFNRGFVYFGCMIAGGQGSGKSYFMRCRAVELLRMYPNTQLYIIDFHDDPDEENAWHHFIEGVEVIQTPEKAWKAVTLLKQELDKRIANHEQVNWKDPEAPLVRVIWDEFQDSVIELGKEREQKAREIIVSVNARQGRKYGCFFDVGYHEFTKEASGFGIEQIKSCAWAMLGDTIMNPSLKLPRNFEPDTLAKDWMLESGTVDGNEARPLVFKRANGDKSVNDGFKPNVVLFPRRKLPKVVLKKTVEVEAETIEPTSLDAFKPLDHIPPDKYRFYDSYVHPENKDWQAVKVAVKARDGSQCRCCLSKNNLHVHHLTYANLGNERLEELVTLCETCHREVHRL